MKRLSETLWLLLAALGRIFGGSKGKPYNPPGRASDVPGGKLAFFMVSVFLAAWVMHIGIAIFVSKSGGRLEFNPSSNPKVVVNPEIDIDSGELLKKVHQAEFENIHDKARIPIEKAMDIVAGRGTLR